MLELIFDWKLFWVIFFVALPGLTLSIGGFLRAWWPFIKNHIRNPGKIATVAIFFSSVVLLTMACIVIGIFLAPSINARFIYFQSLINQKNMTQAFLFEFLPAIFIGFIASLLFLLGYYSFFRKHLLSGHEAVASRASGWFKQDIDEKIIFSIEKNRNHLGLGVRIFFNAVVGEIIFRWGIQSIFIFLFLNLTSNLTYATIVAILITSFVYGLAHLLTFAPGHGKKTRFMIITTVVLNAGLSVVYGVLFWKYGILSAMIAHSLLHIIWYPLDIFYYRKIPGE